MHENLILQQIRAEVKEKYAKAIPYTFALINESFELAEKDLLEGKQSLFEGKNGEEIRGLLHPTYGNLILRLIFLLQNEKPFEKNLENFIENFLINPQAYDFLMDTMDEFKELNETMSHDFQKKFAKARKRKKIANGISLFHSCGLSAFFNGKSEKKWGKLADNPIFRDMIKVLALWGVWSND